MSDVALRMETSFNTRNSSGNAHVIKICASDVSAAFARKGLKSGGDCSCMMRQRANSRSVTFSLFPQCMALSSAVKAVMISTCTVFKVWWSVVTND